MYDLPPVLEWSLGFNDGCLCLWQDLEAEGLNSAHVMEGSKVCGENLVPGRGSSTFLQPDMRAAFFLCEIIRAAVC